MFLLKINIFPKIKMGKKIRDKVKKLRPKKKNKDGTLPKKKQVIKPENKINKTIKTGSESDLREELEHFNEVNRKNPSKNIKNKEKRRELVMLRSSMKNRLKAQLRRKHQKRKEDLGIESDDEDNSDAEHEENIKKIPHTIESLREKDETMIDENDTEIKKALECDEYIDYFNGETEPQILLTTSIKHTGAIFRFMRELKNFLPNSYFYYRKKFDLGTIINKSIEKGFTDIIVVTERLRKPYKLLLIHLPNGPSLEFKLYNVIYQNEIEGHGTSAGHNPELLFKNFKTNLGFRLSRILNGLFPRNEELKGRELVTFHNQRDYIFFRYYRYIFTDDFQNVNLQEIGPRFVMRLLFLQKGLYDPEHGEYEWLYTDKMGVKRRKFYL